MNPVPLSPQDAIDRTPVLLKDGRVAVLIFWPSDKHRKYGIAKVLVSGRHQWVDRDFIVGRADPSRFDAGAVAG